MEKSTSIANLAKALKLFHAEIGKIPKDATNPFFNSSYATLSNILTAIKDALQNAGLSFSQFPTGQNGLTTILMHSESGEYMQCEYFMQTTKSDPQAQGSALSYMRRYSICAVLGLNIDDEGKMPPVYADKPNNNHNTPANDNDKEWLQSNTTDFHKALETLKNGTQTFKDLYNTFKISKQVRAELEEAMNAPAAPVTTNGAADKPWLDMDSKPYNLIVERLKNKTTSIAKVREHFKLNHQVTAALQAVINNGEKLK